MSACRVFLPLPFVGDFVPAESTVPYRSVQSRSISAPTRSADRRSLQLPTTKHNTKHNRTTTSTKEERACMTYERSNNLLFGCRCAHLVIRSCALASLLSRPSSFGFPIGFIASRVASSAFTSASIARRSTILGCLAATSAMIAAVGTSIQPLATKRVSEDRIRGTEARRWTGCTNITGGSGCASLICRCDCIWWLRRWCGGVSLSLARSRTVTVGILITVSGAALAATGTTTATGVRPG